LDPSPKFRALLDQINIVAPVDCAVLLQGETGTGKEVIAQAIHDIGPRRQNRLWLSIVRRFPQRCSESELFGHEQARSPEP